MKYLYILCSCLLIALRISGQSYPQFSNLSGREMSHFSSVKSGDYYYYQLTTFPDGIVMYQLDADAAIIDSVSIPNSIGNLVTQQDRLVFSGLEWDGSVFSTTRQVFIEYDAQLNVIQKITGTSLIPAHGLIYQEQTGTQVNTQSGDSHIYRDTVFNFQKYLVVDTPQVFLGIVNVFTKTGLNGSVYNNQSLDINALYNCFFVKNHLIVQGSAYVGPFDPRALLEFNTDGQLVRGIDYDSYGSGQYIEGALGGWHNERFYFTYRGYDPTIPGCPTQNASIDVRDSSWAVLHRFKLPDCGYLVSGKMPFSFDQQDNIWYAAPHESYKKIVLYKFTPDFDITWRREFDFTSEPFFYFPLSQLPTADGGILLNCYRVLNGTRQLLILKIDALGDVVSSQTFPDQSVAVVGPLVFPNPSPGELFLMAPYAATTTVQIARMNGQVCDVLQPRSGMLDLTAYPSGAYVLSVWEGHRFLGSQVVIRQ